MTATSQTYLIQARLGDLFEDLYITARTVDEAIRQARKVTTVRHRFTTFVA